ncbi:hypothetical protein PSECIP111854_02866 [Pseudoalteromonas sp. CIP111854]|uniref:Flagellar assembly protein FliH/Type III secretion system HrpE domain-containing protein n=1 Tax=Pseudoalteromonas holothuriae TaxID=2963714 RepID=A0A9W4R0E8_9GAMM|nr:FliH/SctL family protein [Pseudoalteromonas sp. CIP111854]CAH9061709.1 hypothetical protein PSECIP111854_02866 [Pseudoalteromonas sp. CIP111854]
MIGSVKTYHSPNTDADVVSTIDESNTEQTYHSVAGLQAHAKPDVRALLMDMDVKQRQQLIVEMFEQDIETIVKTESERGFKEGRERGLQDAQKQAQLEHDEMRKEIDTKQQTLVSLIESVNQLTPQVQLEDKDIYDVMTLAVFRLLGERLEKGDYLDQVLKRATQEYLVTKHVILCLSTEDYQFVHKHLESQFSSSIHENVLIKEDKKLAIGDTRLELTNGNIETNFSEKLHTWCRNLAQLKRSTDID